MIMTLDQIDALMKKGNHFYVRSIYKWEGRVTKVVKDKYGQGFDISLHGQIRFSDKNFVVQTHKRIYEIHNSKTAYTRYLKGPKRETLKINDLRYDEENDKVECWNGWSWSIL